LGSDLPTIDSPANIGSFVREAIKQFVWCDAEIIRKVEAQNKVVRY